VHVSSEAHVVSKVPTRVIGIVIHSDIVRIPEPIIRIDNIVRSYGKVKVVEPKAVRASAAQTPDVAAPEPAIEATVFIRTIEMIAGIASAGIMTNPIATLVDMWRVGMPLPVAEISVFVNRSRISSACGTMGRDVLSPSTDFGAPAMLSPAAVLFTLVLRKGRKRKCEAQYQQSYYLFHLHLVIILQD
jgi:hypothetical protein